MNGLYDRAPSSREVLQSFHNRGCCERVKTCGRLVQENKVWVRDQLNTNRRSLSLTARNTFDKWSSDFSILTFIQSQFGDNLIDSLNLLFVRSRQFELGSKFQTFSDSKGLEKNIILLNIGTDSRKSTNFISIDSIDQYFSVFAESLGNKTTTEVV